MSAQKILLVGGLKGFMEIIKKFFKNFLTNSQEYDIITM